MQQDRTDARGQIGRFGEQTAAAYLTTCGYEVLARNWRCRGGEVDLIVRDGSTLVFVEVRTRRGAVAGAAEESVARAKQVRLIALAYQYLDASGRSPDDLWRIDVVAIDLDRQGQVARLHHVINAIEEW